MFGKQNWKKKNNLCLELYELSKDIRGHFYACDVILFPDYRFISREISNQLARGQKAMYGATLSKL